MILDIPFAVAWLAIIISSAVLETIALHRDTHGDTFSEFIWWVASKSLVLKGALAAFIIWLFFHLVFMVA